jgi:hypothetical protein
MIVYVYSDVEKIKKFSEDTGIKDKRIWSCKGAIRAMLFTDSAGFEKAREAFGMDIYCVWFGGE